ncbi:hypothetical protein H9Q13_03835 [Pontibacter sp. JH31]|uniref:Uncharacterized protein n=1 Tax=Pontibacter aquaedesilientis TaxID=2766980 RepID=A0ABR7XDC4_9BACT|nr:hypothetical protein [Pontibacter aquaedesilientis]MBD1396284.1 hypothetical protein [Pontibacter aquaedesilientis]
MPQHTPKRESLFDDEKIILKKFDIKGEAQSAYIEEITDWQMIIVAKTQPEAHW